MAIRSNLRIDLQAFFSSSRHPINSNVLCLDRDKIVCGMKSCLERNKWTERKREREREREREWRCTRCKMRNGGSASYFWTLPWEFHGLLNALIILFHWITTITLWRIRLEALCALMHIKDVIHWFNLRIKMKCNFSNYEIYFT